MGDVTVGAQSGKDQPEERPDGNRGRPTPNAESAESAESAADAGSTESEGSNVRRAAGDDRGSGTKQHKHRSFWKELPILIGIALVLALLIKTFLLQAFSIPSDSMQNTLQRGDRVLVDKLTPWFGAEPERGEVVVFEDPGGWLGPTLPDQRTGFGAAVQEGLSFIGLMPSAEEKDLIKRVVAVGGDTVECKKDGPVTINGTALDESGYVYPGNTSCNDNPFGPVDVPEGEIWVMGDHRQDSLDSRYHQELPGGGTVSVDRVVGRAVVIAWPPTRWSVLSVPDTFEQSGVTAAATAGTPAALGLAGAVPLVLWRRRRRLGGPADRSLRDKAVSRRTPV